MTEDLTRLAPCKFCGQMIMVEADTETEAVRKATMKCTCVDAEKYQEIQVRMEEAKAEMLEMYQVENVEDDVIAMMEENISMMAAGLIAKAQYELPNGKKLKVARKGYGFTVECNKADKKKVEV